MGFKMECNNPKLSPKMQAIINKSHHAGDDNQYDDTDRFKYLIMKMLTTNEDILWTLHNKDLELDLVPLKDIYGNQVFRNEKQVIAPNGDAYRNVNIFNFLKIPGIQSTVKNFICFEVDDIETVKYNESLITKNITFRTISHDDDFHTDWGLSRQDLLAAIIKSEFDWSNIFGMHLTKIYDKGRVAENGYYYREFIYETTVPNNLVNKIKNGGVGYRG